MRGRDRGLESGDAIGLPFWTHFEAGSSGAVSFASTFARTVHVANTNAILTQHRRCSAETRRLTRSPNEGSQPDYFTRRRPVHRTGEGRQRARERGVRFGRPPKLNATSAKKPSHASSPERHKPI